MSDTSFLGRPLWYEHLSTDMAAAKKFYTGVTGWSTTPFEGSPQPYDILMRPDGESIGGLMNIPPGMNFPPHWVMYVGVPTLEEAVAKIERLGGSALSGRRQRVVPGRRQPPCNRRSCA